MTAVKSYDLRATRVPSSPKVKMLHGKPEPFSPGAVRGVVLHQCAVAFGTPRGGGEPELAARATKVACHAMAFRAGFFVKAAPLEWCINHGNGFNRYAYGLEVDGHYAGNPHPDATAELSWATVFAARAALEYLVTEGRKLGHPVTHIWAHRQSSGTRRGDPGGELWKKVVLDYAVPLLGLETEVSLALPPSNAKDGAGRPIPVTWDPSGVGGY